MNDLEERISHTFNARATGLQAAPDLAVRSLAQGRVKRRRRRQAMLAGSAVAAAAAVVIPLSLAGAVTGKPDTPRPATPPTQQPEPSTSPDPESGIDGPKRERFMKWYADLPQGGPELDAPSDRKAGKRATVRFKGETYKAPSGGQVSPVDLTSTGLLAQWNTDGNTGGGDWDASFILLKKDGSYKTLITGDPQGAAVLGDGKTAVVAVEPTPGADDVRILAIDVTTMKHRPLTQPAATSLSGTTRDGVVLGTQRDSLDRQRWLYWRPDTNTPPRELGTWELAEAAGPDSDRLLYHTYKNPGEFEGACGTVITPADPGKAIYHGCEHDKPSLISPDGRNVLLSDGRVRDLDGGAVHRFDGWPAVNTASMGHKWESSDTLLFVFSGEPILHEAEGSLMVRCKIGAGCERVAAG